jgi:hypothetical protein
MTQRGALIITWGEGRENVSGAKAMEVFGSALGYYDELQKEGRISGYRVFASTSRQFGCLIIEGEVSTLAQISIEDEATRQLALGSAVVSNLQTELCIGGSADDVTQYYMNGLQAVADAGLDPS